MLKAKMYIIVQLEIKLPTCTLPSIIIIPATNNSDASKFLALNALKDAEATKKASKANSASKQSKAASKAKQAKLSKQNKQAKQAKLS